LNRLATINSQGGSQEVSIMQDFRELTDATAADTVSYPMVPIRDVVVFPFSKAAFNIGRASSVRALEESLTTHRLIFLATQHDAATEDPDVGQIYDVGTIAYISNSLRKPEEPTIKVMVEGRERARAIRVVEKDGYLQAIVRRLPVLAENNRRTLNLVSRVNAQMDQYLKLAQEPNPELMLSALRVGDPGQMVDLLAHVMKLPVEDKLARNLFGAGTLAEDGRPHRNRNREAQSRPHDSNARQAADGEIAA
jgi:ATP-dependent Lon protease